MPKIKTNKSVAKRVRVTKNGKVIAHRAGRRHLLSCKSSKKRRALRKTIVLHSALAKSFRAVLNQ